VHKIGRARAYAILLTALLLHLTILGRFRILGSVPDLVLLCVVFFGLFLGRGPGLETGLVSGMIEDLFALDYFGINMVVMGATGLVAGSLNTSFVRESKRTQAIIVFACSLFSMWLHFSLASAFSGSVGFGAYEYLRSSALMTAAYTSVVSIPIYRYLLNSFSLSEPDDLL
jgi:rod shape-determining protein MreD